MAIKFTLDFEWQRCWKFNPEQLSNFEQGYSALNIQVLITVLRRKSPKIFISPFPKNKVNNNNVGFPEGRSCRPDHPAPGWTACDPLGNPPVETIKFLVKSVSVALCHGIKLDWDSSLSYRVSNYPKAMIHIMKLSGQNFILEFCIFLSFNI